MAQGSLTIKEVKERKIALETDIMKMVQAFEEETGCRITYLELNRAHPDGGRVAEPAYEYENRPITNVNANMNLDIVY